MWWSHSRAVILSLAALAGCGFSPVYAPGGTAHGLRGRIDVADPADEEAFELVDRLRDRLGPAEAAPLRLQADLYITEEPIGLLPDGTISRYDAIGRVEWSLSDGAARVAQGEETAFTGYSATSTTVATIAARRDARRRLMVILADRIVADLLSRPLP